MSASEPTDGNKRIVVRFGDEVLEDGFTAIPNLILNHYAAIGITPSEMMMTIHVWQYWWTDRDPYPALSTIGAKMGKSWRTVHRYAKSMEKKGYLRITHRDREDGGQTSSEYDYRPLISAVVRHVRTCAASYGCPDDISDRGGLSTGSDPPVAAMSHEENSTERKHGEELSKGPSYGFSDLDRRVVESMLRDFAGEMNDQAPLNSSVARALRMWRYAGVDREKFVDAMYIARARTQQHTGSIQRGEPGRRQKMPYFFAVLENLLSGRHANDSWSG